MGLRGALVCHVRICVSGRGWMDRRPFVIDNDSLTSLLLDASLGRRRLRPLHHQARPKDIGEEKERGEGGRQGGVLCVCVDR